MQMKTPDSMSREFFYWFFQDFSCGVTPSVFQQ